MPHRTDWTEQSIREATGVAAAPEIAVCGRCLVESRSEAEQRRLALYGKLDLASARELDAHHLAPGTRLPVTVDLTGLSKLDRLAMGVLLRRQRMVQVDGPQLFIRLAAHQVAYVA